MLLIDNVWNIPPQTKKYTFYVELHGNFSKIDHILGQKANLNKFRKIEITPFILSGHDIIKLKI